MTKIKSTLVLGLSLSLIGCASTPKNSWQKEKAFDTQISSYERDAREYREIGNQGMAEYFDNRAQQARQKKTISAMALSTLYLI